MDLSEQYGALADVSLSLADYAVVLTLSQVLCRRTVSRTMDRPNPVPPAARERALSTREKRWLTRITEHLLALTRLDTTPVSPTSSRIWSPSRYTETNTSPPSKLYLMAFSTRLKQISRYVPEESERGEAQ